MEICSNKKINFKYLLILIFIFSNICYADTTFKDIEKKKVSYLDFFLLNFENKLKSRTLVLRNEMFASRVQYSNIGLRVDYNSKDKKIFIDIYAIMDKVRYSKKKYTQKISDCNQVRNLIFFNKYGYKFFTQKRDPAFTVNIMNEKFKEIFFRNLNLDEEEIEFLINNMLVEVIIFHPITKKELTCSGKAIAYELS